MRLKIAIAAALATASVAVSTQAAGTTTISTVSLWNGSTNVIDFGGSGASDTTGVYGETFTAPAGTINSFTFYVNDEGTALNGIYAQVYAWNGNVLAGNPPQGATGPALFSSGPFTISASTSFQAITINTGVTSLTAGDHYVILFADTGTDSVQSEFGDLNFDSGVAGDGGFNFYNNNHTLTSINSNPWDDGFDAGSLAFSATFGATPEPATWALMILGVGAIGFAARRRREASAIAG